MSHLHAETLARLASEPASQTEQRHLDACIPCRDALARYQDDIGTLGSLSPLTVPSQLWGRIEDDLSAEGLLRRVPSRRVPPLISWAISSRIAAGLLLFAAGVVVGRVRTDKGDDAPVRRTHAPTDTAAHAVAASSADLTQRLAALEMILLTTREVARRSPSDEVIEAYARAAEAKHAQLVRQVQFTSDKRWY